MDRTKRASLAEETLAVIERGGYVAPAGHFVDLRAELEALTRNTIVFPPEELAELARSIDLGAIDRATEIEFTRETTLGAAARLAKEAADPVFVLNFASAKNPGGGFLNGSQAQEESLARSSALYASQLCGARLYEVNRACRTNLYTDYMIYSPATPVFRTDSGELLDSPFKVSFLTAPAANAGAIGRDERPLLEGVMSTRAEYVLAVAAARGHSRLVLGAWGCGVFRNDPSRVAAWFAQHLRGRYARAFSRVVFAIYDRSKEAATFEVFRRALLSRPSAWNSATMVGEDERSPDERRR